MAITSASVPRLPGIVSPTLRELLLSGWIMFTEKNEEVFLRTENGFVLPLNKGFVSLPEFFIEDLAFSGDLYAMLQTAISVAEQTIIPIPEAWDKAKQLGENVMEELGVVIPNPLRDSRTEKIFALMLNDPRTKAIPYVDIVDWEVQRTVPGGWVRDSTLKIRSEDDAGVSHSFEFEFKSEMKQLDLFLAARWRQEFQTLIVQIVNEVLEARPEWHELNDELAPRIAEQAAAKQSLRFADLRLYDTRPRFFFSAMPDMHAQVEYKVREFLGDAGYREDEAIAVMYMIEDIPHRSQMRDGYVCFVKAMTDEKLAAEVLTRMQPNIEQWRTVLAENYISKLEYRMSYVEMLERGARGEALGRVRRDGGPFY